MVDLVGQYEQIQQEIDSEVIRVIRAANFINGPEVKSFSANLAKYLDVQRVIPCANGTDALQIAMMALGLKPGDEVIVPAFTYAATAEVIALLSLTPVWAEVDPQTCNLDPVAFEKAITPNTKAVVPVHLYGQCADMENILSIARRHGIYVIEDTAQAIGSEYTFSDGRKMKAGTMGDVGCTSFFPSKNLGCYGDGGALYTNDTVLAKQIEMIANHGQSVKYRHDLIGVNSRLDTVQAAILNVKLKHLDTYSAKRHSAALRYDAYLQEMEEIEIPARNERSTHVFHQYTIKVKNGNRDALKKHLENNQVPVMIYYPIPVYLQKAYLQSKYPAGSFKISEQLSASVLSLPMHTELDSDVQEIICGAIKSFYGKQ
jgi:UDP-2-acetamido-2-deoxy-ribo-hexuluronate aminotransferase